MLDVFRKPIEAITGADIQALIGWPETPTVEFKKELPEDNGQPSPWLAGRDFSKTTRNKLFKEIVALANAQGGHVFVGVDEVDGPPPTASAIVPIPRIADLAERLERSAADAIDPSIPNLIVRGVETDGAGGGVLIFRVPASHAAPHRAPDKECYYRRGTSSEPLDMREIRQMVLNLANRTEQIRAQFAECRSALVSKLDLLPDTAIAFQVSAVPAGPEFSVGRVVDIPKLTVHPAFKFEWEGGGKKMAALHFPEHNPRPILRGAQWAYDIGRWKTERVVTSSGLVRISVTIVPEEKEPRRIFSVWILTYLANALHLADSLRTIGGVPDSEYGVEVSLIAAGGRSVLLSWSEQWQMDAAQLTSEATISNLSFGALSELPQVATMVLRDLHDAAGDRAALPTFTAIRPER